ncbi:MAG TPA: ribosomal protein S18-alanine N-acetyltransferase, partial [Thermodesulfobacteriota bacterium]
LNQLIQCLLADKVKTLPKDFYNSFINLLWNHYNCKIFLMKALPELVIEEMRIEDLDEIIQIEEVSFPTPWPKKMFDLELQSTRSCCRVARVSGVIVGYIVAWMIYDEVHILNIAVHPSFRRMGIGESILRYCLDYFFLNGGRNAILEVRRGNHEAKRLYEKLGFKSIGIRRGYYADTGEDAIVMKLNL